MRRRWSMRGRYWHTQTHGRQMQSTGASPSGLGHSGAAEWHSTRLMAQGKKKRLRGINSKPLTDKANLARLAGFEPTTPWFVAKYSIQLSYSRASPLV